jgi:AcrR family transcriptional regulator
MTTTTTRPYLRGEARRRQLLDAAARLFVRGGYDALTMVALAEEAGVSRRLVYDHFPDLPALYDAFFTDRTARHLDGIDAALARGGTDRVVAFSGAFAQLLAIPPDDRRAIRLVLTDVGRSDLDDLRDRVRAHVERRWLPALAGSGDRRVARARLWMLVSALFALADLVDRDEIAASTAADLAADAARSAARPVGRGAG